MSNRITLSVPVRSDGPTMRRLRGEPPPPRRPRLNAYRVSKFAHRLFSGEVEAEWRDLAATDWRAFVNRRFKLTDEQRDALAAMDEYSVTRIADAVRKLLQSGGEASIVLPEGRNGGELVLGRVGRKQERQGAKAKAKAPVEAAAAPGPGGAGGPGLTIDIPIVKCSFDANCRNWKCR